MARLRGERGFILVAVSVMGLLMMAIWAVAYRSTADLIRVEALHVERDARDVSVTRALAAALALLETGEPPSDPYACLFTITEGAATYTCTGTYASVVYPDTWTVTATLSTDDEIATLPAAPATF